MKSIGLSMALAALAAALVGCEADEPCDDGQKYEQGACVADDADEPASGRGGGGGSSGKGDASADKDSGSGNPVKDAGPPAPACDEDRDAILGTDCSTDADCNCAAPYCAKMPGAPMGFCTVYCKPEPDDCPDGYMCFDLSKLGVMGYEPFCTKMN